MRCCTCNPRIKQSLISFHLNSWKLVFKLPALTFLMSLKMLYPSIKASPEVTLSSPVSILNVVVLPAPLKPRRPKHSPFPTARDSRSTARRVCPLVYTWEEEIRGSVQSCALTQTQAEKKKNKLKLLSYLAELLQNERTTDHRLQHWLTLQDPLPLFSHVPVFWNNSWILY